jgi:uroporphyrinogen decarboxylase
MNYGPKDRVPWGEMGFWPETLQVWQQQGMPKDVHLNTYFGFDRLRNQVPVSFDLMPGFEVQVLEDTETCRIVRRGNGVVAKEFKGEHSYRMPQWLRFPLETRKDWEEEIKPRLNVASPARYPEYWDEQVRIYAQRDYPLTMRAGSVFGWIRNWMGLEGISQALYDDPAWVQEMMDYMVDFCIATARPVLEDVQLDFILLWEDMAYKAGPLISPRMFRQFMLEPYKRLTGFLREQGVDLIFVDSDGDSESLMALWMEGGVNGFYPIERASEMDAISLRQTFGPELRLMGGIDKRAMISGPEAIDAELAHVAPLCAEGGYLPWCDHHVPPDVPLEHYWYYVRRMKEMTLDPAGFVRNMRGR